MQVLDLGRKSYSEVWALQKELVEKRAAGEIADTLILVEHEPVYTLGRAASIPSSVARTSGGTEPTDAVMPVSDAPKEIKVRKLGYVPVTEIERGGKLTFHGPGQLVGYPIFALPHHDLRRYLRDMERLLVHVLNEETLLPAKPCPETLLLEPGQLQTGVWIRDKKIASIGIAVKKWVSYHGFALNITTDLRYFEAVEPCGFNGNIMTTVQKEMGVDADMSALTRNLKRALISRFTTMSERYASEIQAPPVAPATYQRAENFS